MPLTICSKIADTMSVIPSRLSTWGIFDFGRVGSLDGGLAVLDLEEDHRQAGLVVIVEGHLAHRAVIFDIGQRVADLRPIDASRLDSLGEQMHCLPMHIGVVVGCFPRYSAANFSTKALLFGESHAGSQAAASTAPSSALGAALMVVSVLNSRVTDQWHLAGYPDFDHLAPDDRRCVGITVHDDGLRAGIADLGQHAAKIYLAFLVIILRQYLVP